MIRSFIDTEEFTEIGFVYNLHCYSPLHTFEHHDTVDFIYVIPKPEKSFISKLYDKLRCY
jgi:hypothetical protein